MTCKCDLPISAARSLFKFFVYFNFSEVSHPLLNLFDTVFLKDPYLVPFFSLCTLHWFVTLLISTTYQFISILTIPMVRFAGMRQLPSKSCFFFVIGVHWWDKELDDDKQTEVEWSKERQSTCFLPLLTCTTGENAASDGFFSDSPVYFGSLSWS